MKRKDMKRKDLLKKLGFNVPNEYLTSVLIDTDARNEADDPFAIMQFLLSPSLIIEGIIATHYEGKESSKKTMEKSFCEIEKILKLAKIDDVKAYKGQTLPLDEDDNVSDGVKRIIEVAKMGKVTIACLGALTNVARALETDASIAPNIRVLWNGGGPYPIGRAEFNVMQDLKAANIVINSDVELWQTPQDVYATLEVSFAEIKQKISPCAEIGKYLFDNLIEENPKEFNPYFKLRLGENWVLGDNATCAVLLSNNYRNNYQIKERQLIKNDGCYGLKIKKTARVFDSIDVRFCLEDLFAKMNLIYKE